MPQKLPKMLDGYWQDPAASQLYATLQILFLQIANIRKKESDISVVSDDSQTKRKICHVYVLRSF